MFGGLAFMVEGKMACGVVGQELMARARAGRHAQALAQPHTRPIDFTGTPQGCATDHQIDDWIGQAVDHVSTLIPHADAL
jgi:hypothetical protein